MADARAEPPAARQLRLLLERRCREIAAAIKPAMLPGTAFALLMFDVGPGAMGSMAYVASATRESVVNAMQEFLSVVQGHTPVVEVLRGLVNALPRCGAHGCVAAATHGVPRASDDGLCDAHAPGRGLPELRHASALRAARRVLDGA